MTYLTTYFKQILAVHCAFPMYQNSYFGKNSKCRCRLDGQPIYIHLPTLQGDKSFFMQILQLWRFWNHLNIKWPIKVLSRMSMGFFSSEIIQC